MNSRGKQVIISAKQEIVFEFIHSRQNNWTSYLKKHNGKSLVELIIITILDAAF